LKSPFGGGRPLSRWFGGRGEAAKYFRKGKIGGRTAHSLRVKSGGKSGEASPGRKESIEEPGKSGEESRERGNAFLQKLSQESGLSSWKTSYAGEVR